MLGVSPFLPLWASLAALMMGPVVYHLARRNRATAIVLHVLVVAGILALVLLEILPECIELAGWTALIAAGAGVLGPVLAERHVQESARTRRSAALWLALAALGLHAFTDGMALLGGDEHGHGHHGGLPLAVTLHRLPEGAALWWLVRPRGERAAVLALAAIALCTIGGFLAGGATIPNLGAAGMALFQAFVGGVMLHVLAHAKVKHAHH
jgi:uncharacterized protein